MYDSLPCYGVAVGNVREVVAWYGAYCLVVGVDHFVH